MSQTVFSVGIGVSDITPPLEVGFLTSSVNGTYAPFHAVRAPLKARAMVLESGPDRVVLVSLDLLGLNGDAVYGWERFKAASCGAVPPDRVIITCTHTHSAPESLALSDLYASEPYQRWLSDLEGIISGTISAAIRSLGEVAALELATSTLDGFSLQRRIVSPDGVAMSDSMQPVTPDLFEKGPIDRRIRVVRFLSKKGEAVASIIHAVCHPVHEMLSPHVSPDFPGELCAIWESDPANGFPMFLNGAAGNINPPTVSCGAAYAVKHAQAIMRKATERNNTWQEAAGELFHVGESLQLSRRRELDLADAEVQATVHVVKLGNMALVFLPGEPFVETALRIEEHSPFAHTIVIGYAECSVGYIPTGSAFAEGGYEVGPGKWSYLEADAERRIFGVAVDMLNRLYVKETNRITDV
ncbi:hypothetical protein [Parapedobacter sp.]